MIGQESTSIMVRKLVDSLYVEAMVLTDEARAYFDEISKGDRSQLEPVLRVSFSCESLKVTTRLMHIIAWLLAYRTKWEHGQNGAEQFILPMDTPLRLGSSVDSDPDVTKRLPAHARLVIDASIDLYARVQRIDSDLLHPQQAISPARQLLQRLERAL
jgi:regulator of CtrA degradation